MTTIDFTLNAENLFTKVFYAVRGATTRFVVVYGGSGSSKSYSVQQNELLKLMEPGRGDTLVVRKCARDLGDSCYKLFQHLLNEYELSENFKWAYSNDNKHITYMPTGRKLVFRGVDDPQKLKSIVAFRRIMIEEASELTFEDFMELNRRVRDMKEIQITLILNPISENHWIKTKLCDAGGPYHTETSVFRFTYHDNCNKAGHRFITDEDIKNLEMTKDADPNDYRVYVLAEWGVNNPEKKFCWAFRREQVMPVEYDENLLVWASFDFNRNPLTCIIAQVDANERTIRALECIRLPNSDIWKMCERLQILYPDVLWQITGDATGTQRLAISRDNMSYYQVIRHELGLNVQQIKVPLSNPPVAENRLILNAMHNNWNVEINPATCEPLIYDLTYVEVDDVGDIVKDRGSDRKCADFLDAWRYLANVVNAENWGSMMRKE